MKVEIKEISQVIRELTLTVEAKIVNKDYNKALKKVSRLAPPIAGFRKGKAPISAVERHYGEHIKDELFRDNLDKYLKLAIEENDIKSLSEFYPQDIKWEKGEDFVAVFKFEVQPEIEIKNIDGVKAPFKAETIEDEVAKYIDNLREQNSQMNEVDEAVQYNDSVEYEVSYTVATEDGEEVFKETINSVVYEAHQPDDLSKDSIDKKIGETFETSVAAFKLENYNGQEDTVKVTAMVNSVQRKSLPELNDDFAKECDYETLAAMKEELAKELASKTEHKNKEALNKAIITALVRENDFEVPNVIVANEAYRQAKMYSQGQEPNEQMIQILSQMVTPQIKEIYLVEKLKEMFPTEVTEEEVEAYIAQLAEVESMTADEFKEEHKEDIDEKYLENSLKVEKMLLNLHDKVQIVDPQEFAKEQEAKLEAEKKETEKAEQE